MSISVRYSATAVIWSSTSIPGRHRRSSSPRSKSRMKSEVHEPRRPPRLGRRGVSNGDGWPMSKYEYGIDFDAIDAIDIHTHVEIDGCGHRSLDDELMAASQQYFKSGAERTPTIQPTA